MFAENLQPKEYSPDNKIVFAVMSNTVTSGRNYPVLESQLPPSFVVTRTAFQTMDSPLAPCSFLLSFSLQFHHPHRRSKNVDQRRRPTPSEREGPADRRGRAGGGVCVHSPLACMGSWAVSCRWFLKAKPRGNEAGKEGSIRSSAASKL